MDIEAILMNIIEAEPNGSHWQELAKTHLQYCQANYKVGIVKDEYAAEFINQYKEQLYN